MTDKKQEKSTPVDEKTMELDAIKDMTVGQVVRKQKELQDGVEEDDNILDRYIKQHREDIEAEKFDTIINAAPLVNEEELSENADETAETVPVDEVPVTETPELQIHKVDANKPVAAPVSKTVAEETVVADDFFTEPEETGRKKGLIWAGLATILVGTLAGAYIWLNSSSNDTGKTTGSTSSSSKQTTSSSKKDANVTAFEKLYKTFFTDSSLTKIKNDMFVKLPELKAALDKIGSKNKGYTAAKAKYDALEKAIKAIQDINKQFDKPAIVDGELDTTANVKPKASFTATTTGLSAVDTLLTSAINFGRTQEAPVSSPAPAQGGGAVASPAAPAAPADPAPAAPANEAPVDTGATPPVQVQDPAPVGGTGNPLYGIAIPAGVTLQRNLSRVPYDQSKINDVNNEAWVFNPGVLEKIIATSQQRGYIVGNQYILEKVNIINGRGYYNLFRPDGTYLFSINCKTGYFVGNGSGYSDDVDF